MKYQVSSGSWGSSGAFQEYLQNAFDVLYAEGQEGRPKMMTIGLHCRVSGKPGRFSAVERFLKYILQRDDVWITTRKEIAEHWRQNFPYQKAQN